MFRLHDKVIAPIKFEGIGEVTTVDYDENRKYIIVTAPNGIEYEFQADGKYHYEDLQPTLLPAPKWRTEEGEWYFYVTSKADSEKFTAARGVESTQYRIIDERYRLGNYFKTEEDAQKVADKLNLAFEEAIADYKEYADV